MSSGELQTRLFISLCAPRLGTPETLLADFEHLTATLDIACVSLPLNDQYDNISKQEFQEKFIQILQENGIAVLADFVPAQATGNRKAFEKALEQADNTTCDGVHMSADADLFKRTQQVLGNQAIIGVDCGTSKHQAMIFGERGADYISFSAFGGLQIDDLAKWWQELFEVPCLIRDASHQAHLQSLLKIPVDFVDISSVLWSKNQLDAQMVSWLATKCPSLADTNEQ